MTIVQATLTAYPDPAPRGGTVYADYGNVYPATGADWVGLYPSGRWLPGLSLYQRHLRRGRERERVRRGPHHGTQHVGVLRAAAPLERDGQVLATDQFTVQ